MEHLNCSKGLSSGCCDDEGVGSEAPVVLTLSAIPRLGMRWRDLVATCDCAESLAVCSDRSLGSR